MWAGCPHPASPAGEGTRPTITLEAGRFAAAKIGVYLRTGFFQYLTSLYGPVAQLIERVVRNDEVVGLIPIRSTILRRSVAKAKDALRSLGVGGRPFRQRTRLWMARPFSR